jgi:hypothetical protein
MLLVRRPDDLPGCRSTSIHKPLKRGIGNDIVIDIITVKAFRRLGVCDACRRYNALHLEINILAALLQPDRVLPLLFCMQVHIGQSGTHGTDAIHYTSAGAGSLPPHLSGPAVRIDHGYVEDSLGEGM